MTQGLTVLARVASALKAKPEVVATMAPWRILWQSTAVWEALPSLVAGRRFEERRSEGHGPLRVDLAGTRRAAWCRSRSYPRRGGSPEPVIQVRLMAADPPGDAGTI